MTWRWNWYQGEPFSSRAVTDEADSTITSPNRFSTATRANRAGKGSATVGSRRWPGSRPSPPAVRRDDEGPTRAAAAVATGGGAGRHRVVSGSVDDQAGDRLGEDVAPLGVRAVPVERGARRARAAPRRRAGPGRRRRPPPRPCRVGDDTDLAPAGEGAVDLGRRLADGHHGPHRRDRAARPARSRPLLRPPAISTTESKPARAARVAWGAVALESSYQRTPSASPTSWTRCGSPVKARSTPRTAVEVGARRHVRWRRRPGRWPRRGAAPGAARRPRRGARRRGAGACRRPTVASAPEPAGPNVTVSARAERLASTTGSSALATAIPRPGRDRPRSGPWPPRSWPSESWTSRWSGAKLSHVATCGREPAAVTEPERRRLHHEDLGRGRR